MQSRFKKKIILLLILLIGCFYSKVSLAHSPDLASLLIYEQEGKTYLVIKSSLTAFEGEVDYHFKKGAYKTPEEFTELVIQHFRSNCFVIANNDSIRFEKPQVQLGHESTLFVELLNFPKNLSSLDISNTVFKDMPNNQCELIIMLKNIKQKQIILSNENKHEVNLEVQNGELIVSKKANSLILIILSSISLLVLLLGIFYFLFKRKTKSISN
ncbi:MAG: hypothetical protein ACOVO9_07410 [Bacteroidia bacterium]